MGSDSIGYLFPGQGSQHIGMGKDFHAQWERARDIFDQASEILGYSVSDICFQAPEEKLTRTLYAQPAIFVTSFAVLSVLKEKYPEIKPHFVAGLSLGEFTALTAAGALSFEDGLRLVAARAEAMEKAASNHPGAMASIIGLTQQPCEKLALEAGCEVANLNSPEQIVLSGTEESIQKACELASEKGAKRAIPLKVGGAFHSSLMQEAKADLEKALQGTEIRTPECAFVPNVKAQPVSDPMEIRELLAQQLMSPVRWVETMSVAIEQPINCFLEIGPGKVLKGLAKKCQPSLNVFSCGTVDDLNKVETLFQKIEGIK